MSTARNAIDNPGNSRTAALLRPLDEFFQWLFDLWLSLFLICGSAVFRVAAASAGQVAGFLLLLYVVGVSAFHRDFTYLRIGPVYITELILAAVMGFLACRHIGGRRLDWPIEALSRRAMGMLLLFLAYGTLRLIPGILNSATLMSTLRNFALVYYSAFAVVVFLVIGITGGLAGIRTILWALVVAGTVANAVRTVLYFAEASPVTDAFVKVVSGHAALFSLFAVIILMEALLDRSRAPWSPLSLLLAGTMLTNILFVYFSGHRSGLLALLVGLSPVLAAKLSVRTLIALGLAVAVGAAGLLFVDVLQETFLTIAVKFETLGSPLEEANALWRYLYWVSVLKLWAGSPVFGVGFAHDIGQQDPWLVDTMRGDPHNSYLAMLARTGALGFALFGAFIFMVLLLARRSIRQAQSAGLRSVARSVVGCFLAIGVFASMNVTLEGPYHGPFFWMFAGFTVWIGEQCSVEVRQ